MKPTEIGPEKIRDKINNFIKSQTPRGQTVPTGIGWSLWSDFSLKKEDAIDFLSDKKMSNFLLKKTGTHYAYRAILLNSIENNPELARIVFSSDKSSHLSNFKSILIRDGIYSGEISEYLFGSDDPEFLIEIIKLLDTTTATLFLSHKLERIRLEAYMKIGILSCAEMMSKDKSASIRATLCSHLPYYHPIFESMMNDRSKWVFTTVLKKIDKKHIPMMLGSKHLKQKFVKTILDKRLANLEVV